MKVLCNACEAAEAVVMCCADEAALCLACDERVHAANKLAGKHQRISLISSSSSASSSSGRAVSGGGAPCSVPKCDICQEASGYFFCLEDRALLCRNCDMAIHSANPYVSSHQRFLLTGVQVGLEPCDNAAPSTSTSQPNQNSNATPDKPVEKPLVVPPPNKSFQRSTSMSGPVTWDGSVATMTGIAARTSSLHEWPMFNDEQFNNKRSSNIGVNFNQVGRDGTGMAAKTATSGNIFGGTMPDWPLDEFFGFNEFGGGFGFPEHGSSKADSGKLGSSESSSLYRSNDEEMEAMGYLGQVPEISSWTVPEIPSPPTASGLHWQGNLHHVPDIFSDSPQKRFTTSARLKSRRRNH